MAVITPEESEAILAEELLAFEVVNAKVGQDLEKAAADRDAAIQPVLVAYSRAKTVAMSKGEVAQGKLGNARRDHEQRTKDWREKQIHQKAAEAKAKLA